MNPKWTVFIDPISHGIVNLSNSSLITFHLDYIVSHLAGWGHSMFLSLMFSELEGGESKLEAILEIKLPK